jgi:PleD family two-component response regulator
LSPNPEDRSKTCPRPIGRCILREGTERGTLGGRLLNTRVLIVDDDRDTLEIMRFILDSHGAQTAVAPTAAEGLAVLKTMRER